MFKNNQSQDIHFEKDKRLIPFLLSQSELNFIGTELVNGVVFFKFYPFVSAEKAINNFYNRTAPLVHPIDILESVERFKNELLKAKNYIGKY